MRIINTAAIIAAAALLLGGCGFDSARKTVDPGEVIPAESYSFEKLGYDGIEEQDFYVHREAEDSAPGTDVSVKSDKADCSGGMRTSLTTRDSGSRLTFPPTSSIR